MKIHSCWSWELPNRINGLAVVADVWAATTNIAHLLTKAPKLTILNRESAIAVKAEDKEAIIIGEDSTLPPSFFLTPNPAHKVMSTGPFDKEVFYMSINGTRVINTLFQNGAGTVVGVSFTNISAVAEYIAKQNLKKIILVASGELAHGGRPTPEDISCIKALEKLLGGTKIDWKNEFEKVKIKFKEYYRWANQEDVKKDLKIIFEVDSNPVVPVCKWIKEGKIAVEAAKPSPR